jgi:3-oxoacyl-[acyl-carrier-protein] synthase II
MTASPPCLAVITGIGWVSPFGVGGRRLLADVLRHNTTAIGPIIGFSTHGLSRHLGAEVQPQYLPQTEEGRRWSRLSQMTVQACRQAVEDAGWPAGERLSAAGLVVGTEFGDLRSTEAFCLGYLRKGPLGLSPLLFPSTVMNAMAGTASIALGLQGPMLTVNQPDVAGEVAATRAIALIKAGRAPAVLACGVDEFFPMLYDTLTRLNVLSPRNGGEEACRPFDQRHNGPILGEGATAVVFESPAYALARRAPILAEVRSTGWGGWPVPPNRYPTQPHLPSQLLTQALRDARVSPADVDVAYLSASGQPQHDTAELALLVAACGTHSPLVTSLTHLTGAYGSLGTLRLAAAALTLSSGLCPRLDYLRHPIRSDVRFTTCAALQPAVTVLVHGLARGGMQTAMVLARPDAG